jgi:DNA-directed RNA polymerase beta subunit
MVKKIIKTKQKLGKGKITGSLQAWADSLAMDGSTIRRKLNRAEIKFETSQQLPALVIFRALTAESDKDMAMTRKLEAEAKKTERENAVAEGRLHDLTAVEKELWQNWLAPLRAELLSMPRTLAPRCVSAEESQEVLQGWIEATFQKLERNQKGLA